MKEPPDEFARKLRSMRKRRGWSGEKLSKALGMAKTYIGKWENNPTMKPNLEVLADVASVLRLSEGEQRELVQLAVNRGMPEELQKTSQNQELWQANLRHALNEIDDHKTPDIEDERTVYAFVNAAGWLLAYHAAVGDETRAFEQICWPPFLLDGLLADCKDTLPRQPILIPQHVIATELSFYGPGLRGVLASERVPEDDSSLNDLSAAMVRKLSDLYRRFYFSDLDRCRAVVKDIRCWKLINVHGRGPAVTFLFRNVDHADRNVAFVSPEVLADVMALRLDDFVSGRYCTKLPIQKPVFPSYARLKQSMVGSFWLSSLLLRNPEAIRLSPDTKSEGLVFVAVLLQQFRDALYIANSLPFAEHKSPDDELWETAVKEMRAHLSGSIHPAVQDTNAYPSSRIVVETLEMANRVLGAMIESYLKEPKQSAPTLPTLNERGLLYESDQEEVP